MGDLLSRTLGKRGRTGRRGAWALWILPALVALWLLFHLKDVGLAFVAMGEYLQYKFIQRALAVGVLVSLCASLLGVSLVLKR